MKTYILKSLLFIAIIFSLTLVISCGASRRSIAIEDGWDLLGERKINFGRDRDIMEILSASKYTNIRFKVEGREIKLNDLKIVYQNGDKLEPAVDETIPADKLSRIIELGPEGKSLKSLEFKYRTTGTLLKGRANMLVFGQRYNPGY